MHPPVVKLRAEDWARLLSYAIGVVWATLFAVWTPSSYQGVVSLLAVHAWSASMGVGCLIALFGVLTHRDTKVELSGIYAIEGGSLLYLVAQIGFSGSQLLDRLPLLVFIAWHMSLLLPRLVSLEVFRRRVHAAHASIEQGVL